MRGEQEEDVPQRVQPPAIATSGRTAFPNWTGWRRTHVSASSTTTEEKRAIASDPNVFAGLTRLMRMKKRPKPQPASNARPMPAPPQAHPRQRAPGARSA